MADQPQPTRVIIRSMAEFLLRAVRAASRPHDGDMIRTVVFATIQTANLNARTLGGEGGRPATDLDALLDAQLRPVSVNAIAKSFGIPYETTRRAAGALIERGFCRRVSGGLIAPMAALQSPELLDVAEAVEAALGATLGRLSGIGFDFDQLAAMADTGGHSPPPHNQPPSTRHVYAVAMDFMLRTTETLLPVWGDLTRSFIFAGAMSANARAITYDPEQAWAYADMDAPPPDEARHPISVRALAQAVGMPFETVRRHVHRMVRDGGLEWRDGGVIVPMAFMQRESFQHHSPMIAMRFTRMVIDLKRAGYVFPLASLSPDLFNGRRLSGAAMLGGSA